MADNPQSGLSHPDLSVPAQLQQEPAAAAPTAAEPKGFYGGKYESLEAWEQATRHSEQEGARLATRTRELEQELERDRQRLQELEQRANPAEQRQQRKSAVEELTEFGIPVESVRELLREEVATMFAPQMAVQRAMTEVMGRNPDFARYRTDVDTWLASHPEVNQRYQQTVARSPDNADMALEWVFDRFVQDRRMAAAPPSSNGGTTPPADAGIPAGSGSQMRSGGQGPDDEELQKRIAYAKEYKDYGPYGAERLREVLNAHPDLPKR